MSLESQKERRKRRNWKCTWKSNDWKLPKSGKWHKFTDQETEWIPNRIKPKKSMPRNIIILQKTRDKEKCWKQLVKAATLPLGGKAIQMTADFSSETMVIWRKWDDIFQVLKEKNCQPRILYLAKISFRNEGEIKTSSDEEKIRICHWQTYLIGMAKGRKRNLGTSGRNYWYNRLSFSSWVFKIMFDNWSKITLSDLVQNVCRENLWDNYINRRRWRDIEGSKISTHPSSR